MMKGGSINPFYVIVLGALIALISPLYPQRDAQVSLMDLGKILVTGGLGGAVFGRSSQNTTQIDVEQIEVESSKR